MDGEKRFDGLAVSELRNETRVLEADHENVAVKQSYTSPDARHSILEFTFDMKRPLRFRLDVLLPENIVNACVTLNSQVLIGYFSDVFPDGCEYPIPSVCKSEHAPGHEKVSTLMPGKFQSINFKWDPSDVVRFHFYYI